MAVEEAKKAAAGIGGFAKKALGIGITVGGVAAVFAAISMTGGGSAMATAAMAGDGGFSLKTMALASLEGVVEATTGLAEGANWVATKLSSAAAGASPLPVPAAA